MSYAGELAYLAESKSFSVGNKVIVTLRDLPPNRRVTKILLRIALEFTMTGAASAVLAAAMFNLVASIIIGPDFRITGSGLRFLNWQMRGKTFNAPAGVPATNSAVFERILEVMIPYQDPRAHSPNDCSRPTELFKEEPIEVTFGPLPTGVATITGTLRTTVFHEPADPGVVPARQFINYEDWGQKSLILERPGVFTDIWFFKEDGTTLDDSVITDVYMVADGEPVIPKLQTGELAARYNWDNALGGSIYTASATAPVTGEELTDQPAFTASAATTITMEYIPVLVPHPDYKLTQCLDVQSAVRMDLTGSLSTVRVGYRQILPKRASELAATAAKLGIPNPVRQLEGRQVRVKTASKSASGNPRHAAILPARFPSTRA